MTFSQKLGLGLPPVLLRLVLGLIFLWASVPALLMTQDFTGPAAERLVALGLAGPNVPAPADPPAPAPPAEPAPEAPGEEPPPADDAGETQAHAQFGSFQLIHAQDAAPDPDAPLVVTRPRLYGLVLLMHGLAQPDGNGNRMWPEPLATPRVLEILAWSAKITELAGGLCLIIGLFSRLFGFAFVGVMGVALWTTQIAPSIIGRFPFHPAKPNLITDVNPALFGFLPPPYFSDPSMATSVWQTMLFQLIIMAASAALIFTGSGWLSLDRAIFKRRQPKPGANKGDAEG
ncbi:MAG: DoxX family protein [Planctomycetota bacterium]